MKFLIIGLIVIIIVLVFFILQLNKKYNNLISNKKELYSKQLKEYLEVLEKEKKEKEKERKAVIDELESEKARARELTEQIEQRVENQFQVEQLKLKEKLVAAEQVIRAQLTEETQQLVDGKAQATDELIKIQEQLNDYRAQQDSVNKEILRRRQLQEQQDFYRIILSENDHEDMQILQDIRQDLHKREILDKMIYDNYVAKPVKEMAKRVLSGKDPSGIYKITNMDTQEIYIGKSVNVATRWANHIKTACGLEGVADSMFQRALKQYGVEKWTFELLEEVPKDKLTEREKFYIQMYDTTKYGYNQRLG